MICKIEIINFLIYDEMKKILCVLCLFLVFRGLLHAENKIRIGAMVNSLDDIETSFKMLHDAGLESCQLGYVPGRMDQKIADQVVTFSKKYDIKVTTVVAVPGHCVWNFKEGPSTIGLVPEEGREEKLKIYREMIDFCVLAKIPAMHSHFGFIPEDPASISYKSFVEVMKELGEYAKERSILIYFETGQETPITLIRAIKDIGTGNIFINCDLANLVMYGKANSLDAVRLFGPLIKEFHAKDGLYPDPNNPYELGREVSIPEGEVNFPAVIKELKRIGFEGSLTIEREFGDNQIDYIKKTRTYLQSLIDME